jgi:hypothetical protein
MPDKTEEQRKEEEQKNPEAQAEELTDEQLDQAAGGSGIGYACRVASKHNQGYR